MPLNKERTTSEQRKGFDYMVKKRDFYWDIRNLVTSTIEDLNEFEKNNK